MCYSEHLFSVTKIKQTHAGEIKTGSDITLEDSP